MWASQDEATGSAVTQLTAQQPNPDLLVIKAPAASTPPGPTTHATVGGRVLPAASRTITI